MAKLERADRQAKHENPTVKLNGRTIDFGDRKFDARTFARSLMKRKKPKRLTLSEREAAQLKMEMAIARN